MKKVISIFLLVCLTAPFIGSYTWYFIKKREIRKDIRNLINTGITSEKLVHFAFSNTAAQEKLHWEHKREFEYKGQMYDVVKTEMRGDTTYYWCIWDKQETTLNTRIKEHVAKTLGSHPQNKENQKRLVTFLETFYVLNHITLESDHSDKYVEFPPSIHFQCLSGFFKPLVPPPKLS